MKLCLRLAIVALVVVGLSVDDVECAHKDRVMQWDE